MASVIVTMDAFSRLMYPALKEPKKIGNETHAKYRLRAMWPKEGVYNHPEVGEIDANCDEILGALNEVCSAEFDFSIASIADVASLKDDVGVQFPPNISDGDTVKKMDENGRPVRGEFDDRFAGYDFLNVTTGMQGEEVPAVIDHNEDEIDPGKPYSGSWCRLQLEVSAYYKDRSPIVSIDLLAVQYVYDDESIQGGGRPQRPDATKSFGKVKNGTAKTEKSKRMGKPGEKPSRPAKQETAARELVSTGDWTVEEMLEDGWSEEELVEAGHAKWNEVEVKEERPSRPSRPAKPSRPERKAPPAKPAKPAKKLPPKRKPAKPAGPQVVMNEDSDYTYEELKAEEWSDDDIVNSGYGEFDYTNPDD